MTPARRLVINADGFGRSASINAPVIRAHREGVLTTASLMVNEPGCAEAVFFGCLIVLRNKSEISFLWPLTGLSFVFATFAAIWFLDEHVSIVRWIDVALIMLGAGFIRVNEKARAKPPATASRVVSPTAAR